MVRMNGTTSSQPETRGPSALGLQLEKDRRYRIEMYARTMRGRSMDDVLADTFRDVEEGEKEPVFSSIHEEVFGPVARIVRGLFEKYSAWTQRVYLNDIFSDHSERTEWRQAFREVFGEDGQTQLRALENSDKYRTAPTAGLTTLLDSLVYMLSESEEAEDIALARVLEDTWNAQEHKKLYATYPDADLKEKKRINAEFGKRFAIALQLIAGEAERRMPVAAK